MIDFANVVAVGDEQIAGGINGQSRGTLQRRGGGLSAIPRVIADASSGDRFDHARLGIHLADEIVIPVEDEYVAGRVDRDFSRVIEVGRRGRAAISKDTASDRFNDRVAPTGVLLPAKLPSESVYVAVIAATPAGRKTLFNAAVPPLTGPVPNVVDPFMNVTIPSEGVVVLVTVAVRLTNCP